MMLMTRGAPQSCTAKVMLANLPRSIGEREVHQLQSRLGWESSAFTIEHRNDSPGPGNVVLIEVRSENVTEVFTAFGDKGVRAEAVANAAADGAMAYLAADVPVGVHLADQLILLLALAGGGAFRTLEPSRHTKTQGTVIERFLGQRVKIAEEDTGTWRIAISEGR
jgi:RNA 3'-terminal phosphate cyclase (ATP)